MPRVRRGRRGFRWEPGVGAVIPSRVLTGCGKGREGREGLAAVIKKGRCASCCHRFIVFLATVGKYATALL